MKTDVLIVGAGHAGVALAAELRRVRYPGEITLINAENALPYHRPPLSKAWLTGATDADSGWLQPADFFAANAIAMLPDTEIVDLDPNGRIARSSSGESITFSHAVLATGALARPVPAPGASEVNLLQLRDVSDAAKLKATLTHGSRLAIIGGGFIGLEVAATASQLGADVTVMERDHRLLPRLASPDLSSYLAELHRGRGVEILLSTEVVQVQSSNRDAIDIHLGSGASREFDHVLGAVGAIANDSLARSAGLKCSDGVIVDDHGRTSATGVFAIGDVARRPLGAFGETVRLESVHNANEQARIVAATITGGAAPAVATPWFWSDQYETKLQIAGLMPAKATAEVVGDQATGSFALLHRVGDQLVCVEAINRAREFAIGRRQIAKDVERLAVSA